MSNTDIHYKSEQKALQISIRMFVDDLEDAIELNIDEELILFSEKESPMADSLIENYINEHLKITINEQSLSGVFIGREMTEDLSAIWSYLEFENVDAFENISVKNSLLLEMFDDQKNMIHVKVDNKRKAFHILDIKEMQKEISL